MKKIWSKVFISILLVSFLFSVIPITHGDDNGIIIRKNLRKRLEQIMDNDRVSIIIQYKEKPDEQMLDFLREEGELKKQFNIIPAVSANLSKRIINSLRDERIKQIGLDFDVRISLDSSVNQIEGNKVREELNITGKGIKVAVIDTGISHSHPALQGRIFGEADFTGEGVEDLQGHGTHVACIIGCDNDTYRGVAPDSQLYIAKALDSKGDGPASAIIEALDWAVAQNVDVINMSLGGFVFSCDGRDPLSQAVDGVVEKNITVVVAAGNSGPRRRTIAAPGCAQNAITVGAVDDYGDVALFSSRGPTSDRRVKPDIMAPGVNIVSAAPDGEYAYMSGTSQASPHIAGVVALLLDANKDLSPSQVKNVLISTSDDLARWYFNTQNQGIVNSYAAVSSIMEGDIPSQTSEDGDQGEPVESDVEDYTATKASQDLTQARSELEQCSRDAGGDSEAKQVCLDRFLEKQRAIQFEFLEEEEKEDLNLIKFLSGSIKAGIDETLLPELKKEDLKELILEIEDYLFVDDFGSDMLSELEDFEEMIKTGDQQEINENFNYLQTNFYFNLGGSRTLKYKRSLVPFSDVDDNDWPFTYVSHIKENGCISGYETFEGEKTGEYGPANFLTVAEGLKIVLECTGYDASDSLAETNVDKAKDHWAHEYFNKADELGLTLISEETVDPDRSITRAEVVLLVFEAAGEQPLNEYEHVFEDVPDDLPEEPYIETAREYMIISGDSNNNTFRPYSPINRAEMAKVMLKSIERIEIGAE